MNDSLQEPLSVLCDQLGLPTPQADERGFYRIVMDGHEVRVMAMKQGSVVMLGVIGIADALAESRRESVQNLLSNCLMLQAARFKSLGTREVLTLEHETGELVLWQSFENHDVTIPGFLAAAESLLNELEYWKTWLASY